MSERASTIPARQQQDDILDAILFGHAALDVSGRELLSRGGVKEPGMGGVMAPAEPGVKRGFERF
ncbi:hypothetical protein, partial [Burkholderia vietnamiensis]|uniref:hypothetical protein n=1 Tax=Burkholderia vietnamiensis TaxID=60552 RepID=UPI001ABA5A6A